MSDRIVTRLTPIRKEIATDRRTVTPPFDLHLFLMDGLMQCL